MYAHLYIVHYIEKIPPKNSVLELKWVILIRYSSNFSSNHFSWLADGAKHDRSGSYISLFSTFLMWNLLLHSKILSLMSFPDDVADIML